jgi:uncharacterized protein (TIGR03083 family)
MNQAIEALRADRDALLGICGSLTPADWQAESGCPGWTVQDVVSHLGATFWGMVNPYRLPDTTGMTFEGAMDASVRARRDMTPDAVLADYADASARALTTWFPRIVKSSLEVPLGSAGTYPAALLPTLYSFDHYTHIRHDMFAPRGPLAGPPPPADELRLEPALDFIEAALPQQNPAAAAAGSFELRVTGLAARTIRFGTGQSVATITSDVHSFILWITKRGAWDELGVQATGDAPALSAAAQLKVF